MHATVEEEGRSRASDLVTSKFNKRHKPIRTAAKTRRAIKPAIKRFSLSLSLVPLALREKRREKEGCVGMDRKGSSCGGCTVVNRGKVGRVRDDALAAEGGVLIETSGRPITPALNQCSLGPGPFR